MGDGIQSAPVLAHSSPWTSPRARPFPCNAIPLHTTSRNEHPRPMRYTFRLRASRHIIEALWALPLLALLLPSAGCTADCIDEPRYTLTDGLTRWVSAQQYAEWMDVYAEIQSGYVADQLSSASRLPFSRIRLERTHPFSGVTLYSIDLACTGDARYEGAQGAPMAGVYHGNVALRSFARLCGAILDLKIPMLEHEYISPWTCDTRTILHVWNQETGDTYSISDYGENAPAEFWALTSSIDGIAMRIQWRDESTCPSRLLCHDHDGRRSMTTD